MKRAFPAALAAMLVGIPFLYGMRGTDSAMRPNRSHDPGHGMLAEAIRRGANGIRVETSGTVDSLITRPRDPGSQEFVIMLTPGHSVSVRYRNAADSIPLAMGDRVRVRGVFESSNDAGYLEAGGGNGGWVLHRGRFHQ